MPCKQDINYITFLINGTPQIVALASDLHEDFIQVPHIAKSALASLELSHVLRPELPTALKLAFVRNDNAPLGQELLDVTEAQTEPMVEPHSVTYDLRRKAVTAIVVCILAHQQSLPKFGSS